MARVSATSSLGVKVSLGNKKGFSQYDNASPHHSITIERSLPDELTNDELVEKAEELHGLARKLVEKKVNEDIKEAQSPQ